MIHLKENLILNEDFAMFEAGAVVIVVLRKMVWLRNCFGEALRPPPNKYINKQNAFCMPQSNPRSDRIYIYIYIYILYYDDLKYLKAF